jgi:transcriptional repressor NrdR
MKCPNCKESKNVVVDSRHSPDGTYIKRRRKCLSCYKRWNTKETIFIKERKVKK